MKEYVTYVSLNIYDVTSNGEFWVAQRLRSIACEEFKRVLSYEELVSVHYQVSGTSEADQTIMYRVCLQTTTGGIPLTVQECLDIMSEQELIELFCDAEQLHSTGVLPDDAPLRRFTEEVFGQSTVLNMTSIAYNIYRNFAVDFVELMKETPHGE